MNPTTDSQALLTKTFLYFIPFFFVFFVFSPVNCLCPTATPHHFSLFPIIMSNYRSTISTLSIYHSISFIYIMQGSKSYTVTDSQSQKPKTKKKTHSSVQTSAVQPHNTSTKSVKGKDSQAVKHRSGKDKS